MERSFSGSFAFMLSPGDGKGIADVSSAVCSWRAFNLSCLIFSASLNDEQTFHSIELPFEQSRTDLHELRY